MKFVIDSSDLNDLQIESIRKLIEIKDVIHYINITVRVNGEDRIFEGDWLKNIDEVH